MFKSIKKVLVGALAATIMLSSVAFAAETASPAAAPTVATEAVVKGTAASIGGAGVTEIGDGTKAVCDAKVKTVKIDKDVTTINANAFKGLKKAKTITWKVTTSKVTIGKNAFKGVNKKATLKLGKMTEKDFKKIAKKIKKAGFKGTIKYTKVKAKKTK